MKNHISLVVGELGLASFDEITSVLKETAGEVKKTVLLARLKSLEDEKALLKILSSENSYGIDGYVPGPNFEVEEEFEIKKAVVDKGFQPRDVGEVSWGLVSSRLLETLLESVEDLKEALGKMYEDPKTLEIKYFDLSIKYHELHGFFFDKCDIEFLSPLKALLEECRAIIDKKDI